MGASSSKARRKKGNANGVAVFKANDGSPSEYKPDSKPIPQITHKSKAKSVAAPTLPPFLSGEDILYHPSGPPTSSSPGARPKPPAAIQKNGIDKLPVELWFRIIPLLRKKVGPVGFRGEDPGDYKQRDLCNTMRVCRLFYEIAGPILYTRVITRDPLLLLRGINHVPKSPLGDRRSKLELMSYIRRLDLCYTRLDVQGEKAMNSRFASYEKLNLKKAGLLAGVKLVVWDMESCKKAAMVIANLRPSKLGTTSPPNANTGSDVGLDGGGFEEGDWNGSMHGVEVEGGEELPGIEGQKSIFGNLEILTTGAFGERPDHTWDLQHRAIPDHLYPKGHRFRTIPLTSLIKTLTKLPVRKQLIYQLCLNAPSLRHICSNDTYGPSAMKSKEFGMALTNQVIRTPESYTTHVYPRQVAEDMLMNVVRGTLNRWVIDYTYFLLPTATASAVSVSASMTGLEAQVGEYDIGARCARLYFWLRRRLARAYEKLQEPEHLETRIEIYGILDQGMAKCVWNYWANDPETATMAPGFWIWDDEWTRDQEIREIGRILELRPAEGRVRLVDGSSGGCPGCGYYSF